MPERRVNTDRRGSSNERRQTETPDFENNRRGNERRSTNERRSEAERRQGNTRRSDDVPGIDYDRLAQAVSKNQPPPPSSDPPNDPPPNDPPTHTKPESEHWAFRRLWGNK